MSNCDFVVRYKKMEQRHLEQRCAIKCFVKLGECASLSYEKLQWAYEEHYISRTQVFRCQKTILEDRAGSSGRFSTTKTDENVEVVRDLVRSNRRLTLRLVSNELNLNRLTLHQIFNFTIWLWETRVSRWRQQTSGLNIKAIGRMCDLFFITESKMTPDSSVMWLLVLNHGFSNTIPKQHVKVKSDKLPRAKNVQMSKSKIEFSLTVGESFTNLQDTLSIKNFTKKSLKDSEKEFFALDLTLLTLGCSTMTKPYHTAISINQFLTTTKKDFCGSPVALLAWSLPVRPFLFLKIKHHLKGPYRGAHNNI